MRDFFRRHILARRYAIMRLLALITFISFVELKLLKSQIGSNLFHVKVHPPPAQDRSLRGQHRIENTVYDFSLLCGDGIPLLMEDHKPRPCQPRPWLPEQKCPTGFWCHEGQSDSSFYCCPNSRKFANRCHLPPAVGYGKQRMRRFYFDWKTDACHELQYSGIGGNENSFMDYEKCESVCRGAGEPPISLPSNMKMLKTGSETTEDLSGLGGTTTTQPEIFEFTVEPKKTRKTTRKPIDTQVRTEAVTESKVQTETSTMKSRTTTPSTTIRTTTIEVVDPNPCALAPDQGSAGEMAMTMWYFDQTSSTCSPFLYQGAEGNSNRFESSDACFEACGIGKPTRKSCDLPPSIGNGKFNIPRYYFDTVTRKCEQFYYSGKDGNDNRFFKKTKCEKLCLKKRPKKKEHTFEYTTPLTSTPMRIVQNLVASETSTPVTDFTTSSSQLTDYYTSPYDLYESTATPHPTLIFEPRGETLPTISAPTTNNIVDDVFANLMNSRQQQILTELVQTTATPKIRFSSHERIKAQPAPAPLPIPAQLPQHILHVKSSSSPPSPPKQSTTIPITTSTQAPPLSYTLPSPINTIETPLVTSPAPMVTQINGEPEIEIQGSVKSTITQKPKILEVGPIPTRPVPFPKSMEKIPESTKIQVSGESEIPGPIPASVSTQQKVSSTSTQIPTLVPDSGLDSSEQLGQALGQAIGPALGQTKQPHFLFPGFLPIQISGNQQEQRTGDNSYTLAPPPIPSHQIAPSQSESPCALPMFGDATIMCEHRQEICPIGTFCQIGQGQSICCPILDSPPCDQEINEGFGPSGIRRWSFDPATRLCQPFQFKGFKGNQNNFQTFEDCNRACGATNICQVGVPKLSIHTHLLSCQSDADCPLAHNCLQSTPHNLCCQMTVISEPELEPYPSPYQPQLPPSNIQESSQNLILNFIPPLCSQPIDIGFGQMSEHRWSFQNGQCHSFLFRGSGGNMNNFLTRSDCLRSCQPGTEVSTVTQIQEIDRCKQAALSGHGDSYLSRYFYSPEYHQCLHFIYSGEGGNANIFETLAQCLETCVVNKMQFNSFATTTLPPFTQRPHKFTFNFYPKKNVCPKGDALMTVDGEPIQCDSSKAAKCPTDHVCTPVGNTAYCCPSPMNYCLQNRPALSVCSGPDFKPAREIRFTYDPMADRCIRFSYQECRDQLPTSLNTFKSNSQCNRLCCNQGYNLVYKRRLLMAMNDSPIEEEDE
ncbi:unnamed protein product [Caenorhabditis angaria]|uniref:BPTI/Kunitz inhibitor domain-containing protein n=1 Tax=Caenorhabditis angaria TaxID=860376 RepID=A0A9P1IWU1_9PELO|nr:unnamed protein product [Caenorhabditis angaria]